MFFEGTPNTNNRFIGTSSGDTFSFAAKDLNFHDIVSGGGGTDILQFITAGTINASALSNVAGIERIVLSVGTNSLTLAETLVSTVGSLLTIIGSAGKDVIDASALAANAPVNIASGVGADILKGGAGADTFRFAASALLASDIVQGGGGNAIDRLILETAGSVAGDALSYVRGIEQILLAKGDNQLSLTDAFVASAYNKTVSVYGGDGNDMVNAAAVGSKGIVHITAGAGTDTLRGGYGDDIFRFRATDLTKEDRVIGAAGHDTVVFTTSGSVKASSFYGVSGINKVALADGTNTIAINNQPFAHGISALVVQDGSGNDKIDATLLQTGHGIVFSASVGNDALLGGAGDDTFRVAPGELTRDDVFSGGEGFDTLVLTAPGIVTVNDLIGVQGVERIVLAHGGGTITLTHNRLGVNGHPLQIIGGDGDDGIYAGTASFWYQGNAIDVTAGLGLDHLAGSGGDDTFRFAAHEINGDSIDGGGYNWKFNGDIEDQDVDTLIITSAGEVQASSLSNMSHVEQIRLDVAGITLHLSQEGHYGTVYRVLGSSGADVIDLSLTEGGISVTAENGDDVLIGSMGADTLAGGLGNDTFVFDTALNATTNVDTITDYNVAGDTIQLQNAVFTALTATGVLAATAFVKNATGVAADSSDRIIYETDTGKLFYDQDGNGASYAGVQFAKLATGLALTNGDFFII